MTKKTHLGDPANPLTTQCGLAKSDELCLGIGVQVDGRCRYIFDSSGRRVPRSCPGCMAQHIGAVVRAHQHAAQRQPTRSAA
jgi:hypothetical protein